MSEQNHTRLSDTILVALELAITQKDTATADILLRALEVSMTRYSGGANFIERRDYPPQIAAAIAALEDLKNGK